MEYKIVEKEAFTLIGVGKRVDYDTAYAKIPELWKEHCESEKSKIICGMFGVCIGDESKSDFKYLIADNYIPWNDIPKGFESCVIPKQTWAVFSCRGALPKSLQDVNTQIFSEWLPNNSMYEIAGNCNIELYSPANEYEKGIQDDNYYCEVWISVKKK